MYRSNSIVCLFIFKRLVKFRKFGMRSDAMGVELTALAVTLSYSRLSQLVLYNRKNSETDYRLIIGTRF